MSWPILSVLIRQEQDIVTARQRARQVARLLGFDRQHQTRIATAASEIAPRGGSVGNDPRPNNIEGAATAAA